MMRGSDRAPMRPGMPAPDEPLDAARVSAHVQVVSFAVGGTLLVASFITLLLWPVVGPWRVVPWLLGLSLVLVARLAVAAAFRRRPAARRSGEWLQRLRAGYIAQALVFGAAGAWLYPVGDVPNQAFLAFAIGGLAASSITVTAFDLLAALLFLPLSLLPLVTRLLVDGGAVQSTMAVSMVLFIAFMAANAARAHRLWQDSVDARRVASDRADQLRALNENLERLVEERTGRLLENEARFRAVFDKSPAIVALISLRDHRLVEVNAAWEAAFGIERTQAIGRTSADLGLWVDTEARRRAIDALLADGGITGVEAEMRRADGARFWVLINSSTTTIGGEPCSLSTLVDITERKRAQQDLAESEARFRAVFDKGPVVIALIRLSDDRFVEINDAGIRAFGYARDEIIGQTGLALDLWVDPAERAEAKRRLETQGFVTGVEVRLRRKGGAVFWASFSSSTIAIGGEPYSLTTLQDVTERRQLEARVLQAQKMEALGQLAGGVAHDFNNVLTVIRSTAELGLENVAEGAPLHEALATIRDASARASGLTTQLLAFSRRQILQPVVLDVNDLVYDLAPMLRRAIGERIALDLRFAPAPATILADRSSIEQVILNLAINSRDAMAGGGTLTIAVTLPPAAPRQVVLTITDTGVGMTSAILERVFEPFFTTKEIGKGTGLGLSTAHGIVTQSGGDIAVTSRPGAGTTFTIALPWVERTPVRPAPARPGVVGGHETILVVDDDADIRDVVRRALASAGYTVLLSSSGDDALQQLGRHRGAVHLLLTDVVMPGISGQDLAAQVHRAHPSVRILYSSGFVDDAAEAHGGLVDAPFIAKPYSLKALTQKVREVLDA